MPSISRRSWSRRRSIRLPTRHGLIPITNGTPIAGIPKNTVKVGFDYSVTENWKIGGRHGRGLGPGDLRQRERRVPQLPGYAVFGAHTSYQVGKQLQIYGLIQNIFDQRYYTSGGLYDIRRCPTPARSLQIPRTFGPAKPFAIYAGLKYTL